MKDKKLTAFALDGVSPAHATTTQACLFCCKTVSVKKALHVLLYEGVLGTREVAVLTRYCASCKTTYYPGFPENYTTKIL